MSRTIVPGVLAVVLVLPQPITTTFKPDASYPKPEALRVWLYQPESAWTYSHHPHLTRFKGRYYAMWSNGKRDEDAPGQRILRCTSDDGVTWTQPVVLAAPKGERVLTAAGFHQYDGMLVAYFSDYGPNKEATQLRAVTTRDGKIWSDWHTIGIPVCPNFAPIRTISGRLVLSGNFTFPYTDHPSGLTGWRMTGIYPKAWQDPADNPKTFRDLRAVNGASLCEGSAYQTEDGVLHVPLRCCEEDTHLWITESHDNGATWLKPVQTAFPDDCAKFHFNRLPDGRVSYLGNPKRGGGRLPLVLSLSENGLDFTQHYILSDTPYTRKWDGRYKGGQYGYPHSMVQDGKLYCIVSRMKEAVEVIVVPLERLTK